MAKKKKQKRDNYYWSGWSKHDILWIECMRSMFDHEGKVIPNFWLTNKK